MRDVGTAVISGLASFASYQMGDTDDDFDAAMISD